MAKFKPVRIVKTEYGTHSLHFTNPNGRRRRLSVGKKQQHAQRLAVKFNDWLLDGKDPEAEMEKAVRIEMSKNISLREFYPAFMERHGSLLSKNTQEIYRNRFKHIYRCPRLSDIPMSVITKKLVIDYMHARRNEKKTSAATVNREVALIKNMLFRAVEWDIIESNPIQKLKLLPEAEKRQVNLTLEQATSLIEELQEPIASIVELAIYTGFRKENILGMRIESIRFHDLTSTGEVELVVKGGKREIFPLSSAAVEVIRKYVDGRKEDYVFLNPETGKRYRDIHKSFNQIVHKLGLTVNGTKFRFHDLRHCHATWLYQAGVRLDVVRSLLGHRHIGTTDRYVTYDRLAHSNALNSLPRIRRGIKKEAQNNHYSEPPSIENGKNWQSNDQDRMLFLPQSTVSP